MISLAAIWTLLLSTAPGAQGAIACRPDQVIFVDGQRQVSVQVEVADDPQERARGLMFRENLPQGSGMLFIYEAPAPVSFWMRNTLIPLDMIFLDQHGVVRHIHPNARPHDETSIPGNLPGDRDPDRLMVLEVPGGDAARMGLRIGMAMAHPDLPQSTARASCM